MKKEIISLLYLLTFAQLFSQKEFAPRAPVPYPYAYINTLAEARKLSDIYEIAYPVAAKYLYERAAQVDLASVEVEALHSGKVVRSSAPGEVLTPEQLMVVSGADMGSEVCFIAKYRFKTDGSESELKTDRYYITVLPHKQARFTGEESAVRDYFRAGVLDRLANGDMRREDVIAKLKGMSIRFTVDEVGQVLDPVIFKTSSDEAIDKTVLELAKTMKNWLPAETSKGTKIKQQVTMNVMWQGNGC
jgi:hypothetical protein